MLYRIAGLAASLCFAITFVGCEDAPVAKPPVLGDGHEHGEGHAHAETFAEAFAEVKEMQTTIATAFEAGDSEAAHGPLHEVGHALEEMSELAGLSDLSDEDKKSIDANVNILFESFGAVDKKMHDAEGGKDYSEVAEAVNAAIAAIEETAGELAKGGDHDHADHGHADHSEGHDKDAEHNGHADQKEHAEHEEHADQKEDGEQEPDGEKKD